MGQIDCAAIREDVETAIAKPHQEVRPRHSNYPSDIGDDCVARLVFSRTNWASREPIGRRLALIFHEGTVHEPALTKDLTAAGYEITRQQQPLYDERLKLSGKPDGWFRKAPFLPAPTLGDCKSSSERFFDRVDSAGDLEQIHWARKYKHQMMSYGLLSGAKEPSLLWFKNKQTGEIKPIEIPWEQEIADEIVRRCLTINDMVARHGAFMEAGGTPEQWSGEVAAAGLKSPSESCLSCPFFGLCGPALSIGTMQDGLRVYDDPEIVAAVERMMEIKEAHSEYEALNKRIKNLFGDVPAGAVGRWGFTAKLTTRKGYLVAPTTYTTRKWFPIESAAREEKAEAAKAEEAGVTSAPDAA